MTDLFAVKGYQIRITSDRGLPGETLRAEGVPEDVCFQILYLGAVKSLEADSPVCDLPQDTKTILPADANSSFKDPYALEKIESPCKDVNSIAAKTYGLAVDSDCTIWTSYWSQILIKDPEIRNSGLSLRLFVPEEIASLNPHITVYVDQIPAYETQILRGGVLDITIDTEKLLEPEREYLDQIHRAGYRLLSEVDRICRRYRIRYYLTWGTLLGAVRHHDFVAWDDDVDVTMTRREFQRFCAAAFQEWEESSIFCLQKPAQRGKAFSDFMVRVHDRKEPAVNAALDIFILDQAFSSPVLHHVHTQLIRGLYGLCLGHRAGEDAASYEGKPKKDVRIAKMLRRIGRHIPLPFLLKCYDLVCRLSCLSRGKYYFQSNGYVQTLACRFEKKWLGKGKRVSFGNIRVTVPQDTDSCLSKLYGDYMDLPHPYFRVPQHIAHFRKIRQF